MYIMYIIMEYKKGVLNRFEKQYAKKFPSRPAETE